MNNALPAHACNPPAQAPGSRVLIRPSLDADLPAITAVYTHAVLHGTGSFELQAPDLDEMTRRRADVLAKGLPWLVAERMDSARLTGHNGDSPGTVIGYAYATPFRPRPAYRHTLENSVYLDPAARGQGVGRLLLAELIARSEALGARQMTAVIGDAGNAASIGLHQALGFVHVGTLRHVGRKFDRWLDVVLMQRTLGPGALAQPALDPTWHNKNDTARADPR